MIYYDTEYYPGVFTHKTREDSLHSYIEKNTAPYGTVIVYIYEQKSVKPSSLHPLNSLLEMLDYEYGPEDGQTEFSEDKLKEMKSAEKQFIKSVLKHYTPAQYERIDSVKIDVDQFVKILKINL